MGEKKYGPVISSLVLAWGLTACSYNPLSEHNHLTGNPAAAVAGVALGGGTASALGVASKPELLLAGMGGAGLGYYLTTQRFAAAGIIQAGGQVYQIGDYLTIEIPSDGIFDTNTAEMLPEADAALKSAATILNRYPDENIMISGNTSGYGAAKWEQKLSEERARKVANFLWMQGITEVKYQSFEKRKLNYVGYGNYFPIASPLTNEGVRMNSRIQITAYPSQEQLKMTKRAMLFNNISEIGDPSMATRPHPDSNIEVETSEILPEAP